MQLLIGALLALGTTMALIPLLIRWATRLRLLDLPGARKVHAIPVPRVGGIAMASAMLLAFLACGSVGSGTGAWLAALLVLLAFGIQDDRAALGPTWKLAGQLLAALIVVYAGDVNISSVRHIDAYTLPDWVSVPLALCFIVGVTNAFNLADGLDGLAGGTALLCLSGLLLLALTGGNTKVAFQCVITAGAVLGFLRYNTHPARVFMGDAGSQLLGFSAAVYSLQLTQNLALPFSPALPLLLLGVPVIDTLIVMATRLRAGKSPFRGDRTHVHHRLLGMGFRHREAVMAIYAVQAMLLVLAWQLRFASDLEIVAAFVACLAVIVAALRVAAIRGWQLHHDGQRQPALAALQNQWRWWSWPEPEALRSACRIAIAAITAYAVLLMVNRPAVPPDIRMLSVVCGLFIVVSMSVRRAASEAGWVDRAALYTSALIAVALDQPGSVAPEFKGAVETLVFMILAAVIALRFGRALNRDDGMTPLDLLLLLIAIAVPNLPGSVLAGHAAGWTVAKSLLLLYGIECITRDLASRWRVFNAAALVFLATVAVHG